jgi:xylan 1,4-beta-xylosidase
MMNQLGDETLAQVPGGIVTRFSKSGRIAAMAYNYPPEMEASLPVSNTLAAADAIDNSGSARKFTTNISQVPARGSFIVETLDKEDGDAVPAWEAMGKPEPPNRQQTELLRKQAWATKKRIVKADASGKLHIEFTLPMWSLVSIRQM